MAPELSSTFSLTRIARRCLSWAVVVVMAATGAEARAVQEGAVDAAETPRQRRIRLAKGIGVLSLEYVAAPILARQIWWHEGFDWGNPLDNIGEGETYLEDDAWHFACCEMVTELHYQVLTRYFHARRPVPLAAGMTFVTYTAVECLDALDSSGKWSFSVSDEIANCLGIGFWILKHHFPELPVYVRVGVRKWGDAANIAKAGFVALGDYDEYRRMHSDNYAILKTEAICKIYDELYAGVALSKEDDPGKRNIWGITAGYDFLALVNRQYSGWWDGPVDFVSRFGSLSFAFTWWLDPR